MKSGSIGDGAFNNCESLTKVVIPDRFKTLGAYAFANCLKLETVTFNEGVAKVPQGFLYGCESLTSVTIPSTVNYVGNEAFSGCGNLSVVLYGGTQEQYDSMSKTSLGLNTAAIVYNYVNRGTRTYTFSSDGAPLPEYEQTTNYLRTLPTPTARTGYVFYGWYENEDFSGEPVSAPYYNRTSITLYARWLTQEEYNALMDGTSFEKAIIVHSNQTYDVNITTTENPRVYFRFVPSTSGSYSITASNNSGDNYGHLYDSSKAELTNNDDGANNNNNFKITWSLDAGQTYYIVARMYSNGTGTFQITITMN